MSSEMNFERRDYQPAWRSFYKHIGLVAVIFVVAIILSFSGWFSSWQAIAILWLVAILICAGIFSNAWVHRMGMVLSIRDDEVAFDTGIVERNSTEISYQNLRTIEVKQSIMQRFLNLGDICIASSGTSGFEIRAVNVVDPFAVRNEIQKRERAVKGTGSTTASDSEGEA